MKCTADQAFNQRIGSVKNRNKKNKKLKYLFFQDFIYLIKENFNIS